MPAAARDDLAAEGRGHAGGYPTLDAGSSTSDPATGTSPRPNRRRTTPRRPCAAARSVESPNRIALGECDLEPGSCAASSRVIDDPAAGLPALAQSMVRPFTIA